MVRYRYKLMLKIVAIHTIIYDNYQSKEKIATFKRMIKVSFHYLVF